MTGQPLRTRLVTGAVAVGAAAAVMSRFGRTGALSRDESVYLYAGQQLAHGVPPYVSIFDAKGPFTAMVIAVAVKASGWVGVDDVSLVRVVFYLASLATVALVYVIGLELFESPAAAALSAVLMGTFYRFARDSWSGPDAKTIAVVLALAMVVATVHRRWLLAGVLIGLATLTWQSYVFWMVVPAIAVLLLEKDRRPRRVALTFLGPVVIAAGVLVWYAAEGALRRLFDASVLFPFSGAQHADTSWSVRLGIIRGVVFGDYGVSGWVFAAGLGLYVVLGAVTLWRHRHPPYAERGLAVAIALGPTSLVMVLYPNLDFQGAPDLFPVLPFAALGAGWAVSLLGRERVRTALAAAVLAVPVLAYSWVAFGHDDDNGQLVGQRHDAATLRRLAGPDHRALALGDPAPLVLAHLTNLDPDGYVYLSSGVAEWKVEHTDGGLDGWEAQIEHEAPEVVVVHRTQSAIVDSLVSWLRDQGYASSKLGSWRLLQRP